MKSVVDVALPEGFQLRLDFASDSLSTPPLFFVKCVLAEITQTDALSHVFNLNLDRWTQYATFVDAFPKRALAFLLFYGPFARYFL